LIEKNYLGWREFVAHERSWETLFVVQANENLFVAHSVPSKNGSRRRRRWEGLKDRVTRRDLTWDNELRRDSELPMKYTYVSTCTCICTLACACVHIHIYARLNTKRRKWESLAIIRQRDSSLKSHSSSYRIAFSRTRP